MKRFPIVDLAIGALLTGLAAGAAYFQPALTEIPEAKLYDWRHNLLTVEEPASDLRLVKIDDPSIQAVGRWPWPRSTIAELVRRIHAGGPRVIGLGVIFTDRDENQGLITVRELREEFEKSLDVERRRLTPLLTKAKKDVRLKKTVPGDLFESFSDFDGSLRDAEELLDADAQLAEALKESRPVILPFSFDALTRSVMDDPSEMAERLGPQALTEAQVAKTAEDRVVTGFRPKLPLPEFVQGPRSLGHVQVLPGLDGTIRSEAVVMRFNGRYYPSLALGMARTALRLKEKDLWVEPGRSLRLGKRVVPLDEESRMLIRFPETFEDDRHSVSAADVLRDEGDLSSRLFKDKIVLVGITDPLLAPRFSTPSNPLYPIHGLILASLRNLMEGSALSRPPWAFRAEMSVLLAIGLFVMFVLPLWRAVGGALLTLGLGGIILGVGLHLFISYGWWIKIFLPLVLLATAYAVLTLKRYFFTERRKELVEAQSIETNKMLGLSFQGQGLLDMAFEKFQKCPVDGEMQGVLYNLGLDFERKRQFAKALVVYEHIAQTQPTFKDVKSKIAAMRQSAEGAPATLGAKAGGTVVLGAGGVKPTLGRYEIQKELGRGAMGIVYLGKDPKINRAVAIKTLRFDDDMDAETAKMVKERFFREAESAGTLNHPHIIRIFDAGEDGDISYIAMELLEGDDLKKVVDKAHLLPVDQVVNDVVTIAEALDYAHAHGVVHRDIKPANVMRLKDGTLRVTDFGIARITASSKTATGTVMGTPSYMSPEQLSGKKVDGRSDLFSLGVMLYEMLTGEKPFEGESIATLLFKIANEPAPDPRLKSPERVTTALRAALTRALEKDPDRRYQRGAEFAADLRRALQHPDGPPRGGAAKATAPATVLTLDASPSVSASAEPGAPAEPALEHTLPIPTVTPDLPLESTVPLPSAETPTERTVPLSPSSIAGGDGLVPRLTPTEPSPESKADRTVSEKDDSISPPSRPIPTIEPSPRSQQAVPAPKMETSAERSAPNPSAAAGGEDGTLPWPTLPAAPPEPLADRTVSEKDGLVPPKSQVPRS